MKKNGILIIILSFLFCLVSCGKTSLFDEVHQKLMDFQNGSSESNFLRTSTNAYQDEEARTIYNSSFELRRTPYFKVTENSLEKSYIIQNGDRMYEYQAYGNSYRGNYLGNTEAYESAEDNYILDFSFDGSTIDSKKEDNIYIFEIEYGNLNSNISDLPAFQAIQNFNRLSLKNSKVRIKISFDNYSYTAEFAFIENDSSFYLLLNQSHKEFEVILPEGELIYNSNSPYYEMNQVVSVILNPDTPVVLNYKLEAGEYYMGASDGRVLSGKYTSLEIKDESGKILDRSIPLIHTNLIQTDFYFTIKEQGIYSFYLKNELGEALTLKLCSYEYSKERPSKEQAIEIEKEFSGEFLGNRDYILLKYNSLNNEFVRFQLGSGYLVCQNDLGTFFAENDVFYVTKGTNYIYLFSNHYFKGTESLYEKASIELKIVETFKEEGLEATETLTNTSTKLNYWIGGGLQPKRFNLHIEESSYVFFEIEYVYTNLYLSVIDMITIYDINGQEVDKTGPIKTGDYIVELSCPFYDYIFAVKPRVITIHSDSKDYYIRLEKTNLAFDSDEFPYYVFVKINEAQENKYIFTLEERCILSLDAGISIYDVNANRIQKLTAPTLIVLNAGTYYFTLNEVSSEIVRVKAAIVG